MLDVVKTDRGPSRGWGWRCSHYSVFVCFWRASKRPTTLHHQIPIFQTKVNIQTKLINTNFRVLTSCLFHRKQKEKNRTLHKPATVSRSVMEDAWPDLPLEFPPLPRPPILLSPLLGCFRNWVLFCLYHV